MNASNDGSESVDQFLARISSLSQQKDDEDAERARKMEEDMLQARKERQARRAERARSISPVKTGPTAATLPSPRVGISPRERSIEPPVTLTPRSQTQTPSRAVPSPHQSISERFGSSPAFEPTPNLQEPPSPENPPSPSYAAINATAMSRSGTLSWQQRPTSRGFGSVRGRPLSGSRSPVRSLPETPKPVPVVSEEREQSRKDIAVALNSKDPSWFRQTQDRGIGSTAYRKSSDQEQSAGSLPQRSMRLPGMASESSDGPIARFRPARNHISPAEGQDVPPLGAQSISASVNNGVGPNTERALPTSTNIAKEPVDTPRSISIDVSAAAERDSMSTRSSNILDSTRSPSPTKGLGGFVQSAMMRRSDSVSKRWSVQANAGLKRGDSIASNRPTFSPPATVSPSLGQTRTISRDPRSFRDGTSSPLTGSRPSSSHNQAVQELHGYHNHDTGNQPSSGNQAALENSSPNLPDIRPSTPPSEPSLSRSPSKTLDPRRWSPTKASWLESALSKPDSPRPGPAKIEPPAWKVDMHRSKGQKDLQESPKRPVSSFDPINTGGLLRSPPPGSETKLPPLFGDMLPKQSREEVAPPQAEQKKDLAVTDDHPNKPTGPILDASPSSKSRNPQPLNETRHGDVHVDVTSADQFLQDNTLPESMAELRKSQDRPPPVLKSKPIASPKTDLRPNLKSRQTGSADSEDSQPEFKAVFGKLKRTQTQNYIAPDVLKDNISRGKASLNITGGPQPRRRVDEFKESILQKKEAMKQSGGSVHQKTEPYPPDKQANSDLPEALARRKTLHKAKGSVDIPATTGLSANIRFAPEKPSTKPEGLLARRQVGNLATDSVPKADGVPTISRPAIQGDTREDTAATAARQPGVNPSVDSSHLRKAPLKLAEESPFSKRDTSESLSGKLAARLNPALAGLIARGSSPKPHGESAPLRPSPSDSSSVSRAGRTEPSDNPSTSGYLEHMTKGRARGPKRRAPKSDMADAPENLPPTAASIAEPVAAPSERQQAIRTSMKPSLEEALETNRPSPLRKTLHPGSGLAEKSRSSEPERSTERVPIPGPPRETSPDPKVRPKVNSKSPELRRTSTKTYDAEPTDNRSLSRQTSAGKNFDIATDKALQDFAVSTIPSLSESVPKQNATPLSLTPNKSNIKSPPKSAETVLNSPPVSRPKPKLAGLALDLKSNIKKPTTASVLTPPSDSEIAVPVQVSNSFILHGRGPASRVVEDYFGSMPRLADRADFDTEAFLTTQINDGPRIKTISGQIWEVNGDGKRSPLPPQQEHILFEECMYLCVHTFEPTKSPKITEAYLWAGDSVSDAAIEDAQLFCRKVARENSAKLEVVKQGKEDSKFFSALGGIVIVRKSKSSALYMLCGRRHHGHVAFDEVEMSAAHLCSGFPFLISGKFGKLYLWKGQGSGTDEVSAARLISMDLSLTGEIEEVSEGQEPVSFWDTFSDPKKFQPSEMWSMRSMDQHKGFPCRLFRVEPERPKSSSGFWGFRPSSPPKSSNKMLLQEISPFSQKDLDQGSVHILDAHANVYVLPGSPQMPKPAEFVSALHIAQEMAVLAPSVEDRSLLPSCEVIFGEPPQDFKAAFRKWLPGLTADMGKDSVCVEVAEVLRVLD